MSSPGGSPDSWGQRFRQDDHLRMLLGLVTPNAGRATAGAALPDLPNPSGTVGAVLEATSFHPARRARTHLRMVARAGGHDEGRADVVLDLGGLTADAKRKIGGFSMGMRQRWSSQCARGRPRRPILDDLPTASTRRASPGCGT